MGRPRRGRKAEKVTTVPWWGTRRCGSLSFSMYFQSCSSASTGHLHLESNCKLGFGKGSFSSKEELYQERSGKTETPLQMGAGKTSTPSSSQASKMPKSFARESA